MRLAYHTPRQFAADYAWRLHTLHERPILRALNRSEEPVSNAYIRTTIRRILQETVR